MNNFLSTIRPVAGSDRLRLDLPVDGHAAGSALFAPGSLSSASADSIASELVRSGIAVLHLPTDGIALSDDDVHAAVARLSDRFPKPFLAIGHGEDGGALLRSTFELPSVKAVATLGVPASEETTVRISRLRKALLVLHAPTDTVIGIEHAGRLIEPARHPKSFVALDGADHELSRDVDARFAARVVAAWATRYLPAVPRSQPAEGSHGHSAVARIGRDRFHTDIVAGGHALVADEPLHLEGTDHGPTPYDLLLAGLGGCTAITIRMYADRKGWPLDAVQVRLHHEKVNPGEAGCEAIGPGKVDLFRIEVGLEGDLSPEQQARLMEIADKCPVHRTLKSGPCLRTSPLEPAAAESHA